MSRHHFARRLAAHAGVGFAFLGLALLIGAVGYRATEGMGWLDAFLNAAMILSGMGPVSELDSSQGKLFATVYSLFSGVVFLGVMGVIFAPLAHRVLHRLHLEGGGEEE